MNLRSLLRHSIGPHACRAMSAWTLAAALAGPAQAQLRLPSLPGVPSLPMSPPAAPATSALPGGIAPLNDLGRMRRQRIGEMLAQRRDRLEADPAGEPVVRGEVLLVSPSAALLDAARAEGFDALRDQTMDALDIRLVTLRVPAGWDTGRAVRRLRELDPQAAIDFNHLYLPSGEAGAARAPPPARPVAEAALGTDLKVGLIDAGVETGHPLLRNAAIRAWGCGGRKVASAHGTAVASLLVGRADGFRSAVPAATLFAADVYCDDPAGGSIEGVAAALAWLVGEGVRTVNISLVGPANRMLEAVVRRAAARGVLLVAAVGNDGPAAPPLYPAGYAEVVAVTGVDARGRVLPEAGRGLHVAFAAPGADMAAAGLGRSGYAAPRGTSFAAPWVTGRLAELMHTNGAAAVAVGRLAREARDAGAPGRDPVYGYGVVAAELRTDPAVFSAARR